MIDGLIITADDFGSAVAVNEAVERAYSDGILTAASLMVAGPAASDAAERARRLPQLGVGLHLVLVDGVPILAPERIPALVGRDGRFRSDQLRTALMIALFPAARAQLGCEIEAQFAAFAATGLPLDHVNAHKHFHLHPIIASAILAIGPRFGLKALRVPYERGGFLPLRLWATMLGRRARRAGIATNDQVIGLAWSGNFDAPRMRQAIASLPGGLTEIYCHPANADAFPGSAPGYRYLDEFAALLDHDAQQLLDRGAVRRGNFMAFAGDAPLQPSTKRAA